VYGQPVSAPVLGPALQVFRSFAFATMQSLGATGAFVTAGAIGADVAVAGNAFDGSSEDDAASNEDNPFGGGNLDSLKRCKSKIFRAEQKATL